MYDVPISVFMTREVFAVAPETSLEVAGRLLYARHITGVPVVDPTGRALGVLTAKDIADPDRPRDAAHGSSTVYRLADGVCQKKDGGKVTTPGRVADIMTTFVIAVPPETTLQQAMKLMTSDEIHRLFVIDDDKRIVGILSSMDVMRALLPRS